MSYKNLEQCLLDLEQNGQLLRIEQEVDPHLEMAEIQRQVYAEQGPALLFENVKGSPFRAASNVYGTFERTAFIFRHSLKKLKKVIQLKKDPTQILKSPGQFLSAPLTALKALPMRAISAPVLKNTTRIDQLPQIVSWPMDGGAFVTLPQVMTLPPGDRNMMHSNLGMYRIQLSGNEYELNKEVGLHYQLHRGIGIHHTMYNESDEPFRVSIFVGGPPSHAFAAIMPMPEGLSELTFAGMLG
ncbi:MAG: UbiD family decarboxylase, partial [Bacteroidetes bacterium]